MVVLDCYFTTPIHNFYGMLKGFGNPQISKGKDKCGFILYCSKPSESFSVFLRTNVHPARIRLHYLTRLKWITLYCIKLQIILRSYVSRGDLFCSSRHQTCTWTNYIFSLQNGRKEVAILLPTVFFRLFISQQIDLHFKTNSNTHVFTLTLFSEN